MYSLPFLIRRFGPANNDRFMLFVIVGALIFGIFVRFTFGMRHIASNQCRKLVKQAQRVGLITMIFLLIFLELFICIVPPQALAIEDILFVVIATAIYLFVMSWVLYPGRRAYAGPQPPNRDLR